VESFREFGQVERTDRFIDLGFDIMETIKSTFPNLNHYSGLTQDQIEDLGDRGEPGR